MSERTTRRQRKLPSMPQSRRVQEFWPTFRGAVDWMQKHQEIIETALNLLEIYPKLIQHKSCDRLWDFISKVAYFDKQEVTMLDHRSGKLKESKRKMVTDNNIPSISVTETKDNKTQKEEVSSVYVCGDSKDEKWQSLVLGLSGRFSVKSSTEKKVFTSEDDLKWVINTDSFIFLMDSKTVADMFYLDKLQTALAWKVSVIFVRDPSFVLPDVLPNSVLKLLKAKDADDTKLWGPLLMRASSAKAYSEHATSKHDIRPLSTSLIDSDYYEQSIVDFRQSKASLPLSTLSKSPFCNSGSLSLPVIPDIPTQKSFLKSSKSDSSGLSNAERSIKIQDSHHISTKPAENSLKVEDSDSASVGTSPLSSVTFSDILSKGYENAILYHHLYHNECLDRLTAVLVEGSDLTEFTSLNSTNSNTNTPSEVLFKLEDSSVDDVDAHFPNVQDMAKAAKQNLNKEKRLSLESERLSDSGLSSPVETIYLIYSDNKGGPELVHWPVREHREVSASPSIESLGFQDVDLSKNVNQIDLALSDDSF